MIYTVTFNPALDYCVHMEELPRMGETNRSGREELYFGGKGINVSRILRELGKESVALGFVAGFTGEALEKGIREMGIRTRFVHLPEGMTRINVKLKCPRETEINAAGPRIPERELHELYGQIDTLEEGDTLILAGSIPASLPGDTYEQILQRLEGKQIRKVVDASGELLRRVLPYHPFLVKPNRAELEELFDTTIENDEELRKYAEELQKQGACNVLVSLGKDGAFLLTEMGESHRVEAISEGTVKNTVGAGDSMVAGFLVGFEETGDCKKALAMGIAAATATAFSEDLGRREEILRYYGMTCGEKE